VSPWSQAATYHEDDADHSRRIAIKLQEANTKINHEKGMLETAKGAAAAAAEGDAAAARKASAKMDSITSMEASQLREVAARDRAAGAYTRPLSGST
jgi:hypothetical protein